VLRLRRYELKSSENRRFRRWWGQFGLKFLVEGGVPYHPLLHEYAKEYITALSLRDFIFILLLWRSYKSTQK